MFLSKKIQKKKGLIAGIFFFAMACETFTPAISYALTSGPSQPEMKGFEPVGTSNMVDPFSGDFSYNIPLMDVDGYPINLNYHAGATPDDEASWVGYGWSLTPGAINRQLRGLPDDFNGSDQVTKETNYKDHITKGLTLSAKLDVIGIPTNGSVNIGVEYDNYRGIGTRIGVNAGLSLGSIAASAENTANQPSDTITSSVSLGLSSSSMNGANANLNFSVTKKNNETKNNDLSLGIGFPYNSRAGLQGMSFSGSCNPVSICKEQAKNSHWNPNYSTGSYISFSAPTYVPTIDVPSSSQSYSLSLSAGVQVVPVFIGTGISGYWTKQYIADADKRRTLNAYGFLYAGKGKNDPLALMDFNREKDIPYSKEVSYIPVPIPTNDLFVATSQAGGGQYRISRNSHGVFFDPSVTSKGNDASFGLEAGFGLNWDIGADVFFQKTSNATNKWRTNNNFSGVGDFTESNIANSFKENAWFKKTGEPVVVDDAYYDKIHNSDPIAVGLNQSGSNIGTNAVFRTANDKLSIPGLLERNKREPRNEPLNYLPASEAAMHALEKTIISYPENTIVLGNLGNCSWQAVQQFQRVGGYRKKHHISEITIISYDGKRTVYGIPVYNTYQEEVTFSVTGDTSNRRNGLIEYNNSAQQTAAGSNSREKYYSKQTLPAYATSFLLTSILSPDYVDVTGDGISDDDLGNAVKFNYHKLPAEYQWRTPYGSQAGKFANYSEGFLSDKMDDKANYTYGKKEQWYLHSIESKTMVALFVTEDRDDGLGVLSVNGQPDTTNRLKRLKEIRLYSKADVKMNNYEMEKLTPVKVVHFEYSYSLMQGIPNSVNGGGKLTLKKLYFTYGASEIGIMHPYTFTYNADSIPLSEFSHKQYDRWGNYKDYRSNPNGITNAEFPYTLQDRNLTNEFASRWQLSKINLPTGGSIAVNYEADDYGYVQNKRAMQMMPVAGIGSGGSSGLSSGMIDANEVFVDLPVAVNNADDFIYRYLDGEKYLYFKMYTNLDNAGHFEYVPGYAKFKSVRMVNSTKVAITLEKENVEGVGPVNPMAQAAWQFIKSNLPKYAYPGYDNLEQEGSDLKKAVQSLSTAVANLQELLPNAYGKIARRRGYGNSVDLGKSFVRLQSPSFAKTGGGSRVKKIIISDSWQELTGVASAKTATYTQEYAYTKIVKDNKGNDLVISSGVASYEPLLGGEENPFHQPVFYRQNVILQLDNYYYIEQPFCESLYPGPSVGYSCVTVKSIGSGDQESRTGKVINEFYTAKDYPTKVVTLSLEKTNYGSSKLLNILTARMVNSVGLSQGYQIENNDMHGKPKSVSVINTSGINISSSEYYYKTINADAENSQLDNRVKLLMPDATVADGMIGKEIESYTDMRESNSINEGTKLQGSFGSAGVWIFSFFFGFPGFGGNADYRYYHSASTIKTINTFAVLDKVVKRENGSSVTTENILWDGTTGDVVMTRIQNEFDDPVYNLTLPANWVYKAMGQSYQNSAVYFSGLATNNLGQIVNANLVQFFQAGDEIADLNSGLHYWVINTNSLYTLIDRDGRPFVNATLLSAKIIRSGYRNILSSPVCTYASLQNPINGNKLDISVSTKVLHTEAIEYTDNWLVPKAVCNLTEPAYNPYVAGHLGNWRTKTSYAYQSNRENLQGNTAIPGSTDIRRSGAYTQLTAFWQYDTNLGQWIPAGLSDNRWIRKNVVTAFNTKGISIEEKDPLNRYSSVLLGYMDSKPIAVANNSKYSELMYDGFEDYGFLADFITLGCNYEHFNFSSTFSSSISIDNHVSHSGNSSLKLSAPVTITQATDSGALNSAQYTIHPVSGLYVANTGSSWSNGFTPVAGKKYLFSVWVKDNAPRTATTATLIKINGVSIINTALKWPVVEGWKRVEIPFVVPVSGQFSLSIIPSGNTWIDDIRIAPFDGQVKSYAYDALSQRLMAEMDENNFATFYEYDSEGTLTRVKKETEKGIVTIKETRSSYPRK